MPDHGRRQSRYWILKRHWKFDFLDSGRENKHQSSPAVSKGQTTASTEGTMDQSESRHVATSGADGGHGLMATPTTLSASSTSSYRPHAIVVNAVQVGCEKDLTLSHKLMPFFVCLYRRRTLWWNTLEMFRGKLETLYLISNLGGQLVHSS